MKNVKALFESFGKFKIGVVGDVMLDTYMWGTVDRISPEAPVPIVSLRKRDYRIGGAGNVALNLVSLGANVHVLSAIGNDEDGDKLEQLFSENKIQTGYLLRTPERITTNKIRIISRNQQMMRLDREVSHDLVTKDQEALLQKIKSFVEKEKPDVMVFEDYNKGVLTEPLIKSTIELCRKDGIITAVDPKRKHFFSYRGVDIFKPNLKEVKEGLNLLFDEVDMRLLQDIHAELKHMLHHDISLITLSDKGVFYQQGKKAAIIPSHLRNIADVSGAGDTVIAVGALVYAATKNVHLMAEMANIAGGLVCEEVGTAAIHKESLMHECELLLS